MHVIEVAHVDYVFGVFRHFSKFDNHEKSPFEFDSAICLLSAVAPPTCAERLALVNNPFHDRAIGMRRERGQREGARAPAESRVSAGHRVMLQ